MAEPSVARLEVSRGSTIAGFLAGVALVVGALGLYRAEQAHQLADQVKVEHQRTLEWLRSCGLKCYPQQPFYPRGSTGSTGALPEVQP
jgi:hypothetical protein